MHPIWAIILAVITGFLGFFFGTAKFFREEKHKAYRESLPSIIKMAYEPRPENEEAFNKALAIFWLYGNKKVAKKVDKIASLMVDPSRGDIHQSIKEAIVEMRKDLRLKYPGGLGPEDIAHLYAKVPHS